MDGDSAGARNRRNYQDRPFRILLVCEANVCRSPMAEYLLRKSLSNGDGEAAGFELASAGTHGYEGIEMDPPTADQLRRLDADPSGFRSHILTDRHCEQADLILVATLAQRSLEIGRRGPRQRAGRQVRRGRPVRRFVETPPAHGRGHPGRGEGYFGGGDSADAGLTR